MERQCQPNTQYSRREYLEVVGIPVDFTNENLTSKMLEVFNNISCEILSRSIESCHHLTNINDRIIVKLLRRQIVKRSCQ